MSPSGKSEQKDSNLRPCLLMILLSPLSYVPMLPGCRDPAAVKIYNTEVNVTTMSASVFQPTDDTIKSRKYPLLVIHFLKILSFLCQKEKKYLLAS